MKVITPIGAVVEVDKSHYEANKQFLTPYKEEAPKKEAKAKKEEAPKKVSDIVDTKEINADDTETKSDIVTETKVNV